MPLSMAMRAPLETGIHSTGTRSASARSIAAAMRSHSGAASEPMPTVGSESTSTRRMPSETFSVGVEITPKTTPLALRPKGRPITLTARGDAEPASRSYSSKEPTGSDQPWPTPAAACPRPLPVNIRMIS